MLNGLLVHDTGSVTRFGEILPLWPIFKIFGNIFKVYLVVGKVFSSLWYNLYAFGQIFIAENGQILKAQSGRVQRNPRTARRERREPPDQQLPLLPRSSHLQLAPPGSGGKARHRSGRVCHSGWIRWGLLTKCCHSGWQSKDREC